MTFQKKMKWETNCVSGTWRAAGLIGSEEIVLASSTRVAQIINDAMTGGAGISINVKRGEIGRWIGGSV
jgi:hypothetical protein